MTGRHAYPYHVGWDAPAGSPAAELEGRHRAPDVADLDAWAQDVTPLDRAAMNLRRSCMNCGQPERPHNYRHPFRPHPSQRRPGDWPSAPQSDPDAVGGVITPIGRETPETPCCVAHGRPRCSWCARTDWGRVTVVHGECSGCSTYGDSGMHWDTCPGRVRLALRG
jgi:hypothetical protein